ncbi:hypothetical protein ATE84_3426 [Aquimarina sp. MAR_2010_214]|uniref:hypothetical protein n=1 Tax=Aquimarina sp. MAR_2010_214 TaxID=1250026 RepID=UPI000C7046B3|nr:hypothetical protein [Aquimarina sp. MAR_2010_214]PKV51351.1 hypothetical protein ATE84_3426 [Aquimarina sp. MAR_2010_214]
MKLFLIASLAFTLLATKCNDVKIEYKKQRYQIENHLEIDISNAVPNQEMIVKVFNVPERLDQRRRITTDSEGKASLKFIYVFHDEFKYWCDLTTKQRNQKAYINASYVNDYFAENRTSKPVLFNGAILIPNIIYGGTCPED